MKSLKRILCLMLFLTILTGLTMSSYAPGYRLSGTVTSFGDPTDQVCLWLNRNGVNVTDHIQYVTGDKSDYSLTDIKTDIYTLCVSKKGHATRFYDVALENSDQVLDVKICPLGDLSGDGEINISDISITYAHCKGTALLTDSYKLACADYNCNGKVNLDDTSDIYSFVRGINQLVDETVTLKVWAPARDLADEEAWLFKMEQAFQKAHPEYNIIWDNNNYYENEAGHLVAENPEIAADVYMFANDLIGTLVNSNAILPISGQYLEQVLKDNSQTMVNTVTYSDEQVYGFPMSNNTWFMYYNKDTFSEEDVKSLDTMLTKGTVAFSWDWAWYGSTFFLANGGTIFGEKGNDASAGIQFGGDNGGYEAALKMVQLAAHPNLKDDVYGLGHDGLITGEIDAFFSGSWAEYSLREALGDKLGAVQLPTVEIGGEQKQMKAFAGSSAVGVNPHADNTELAMAFAAFLATPEAQKLRYECSCVIPAATSLASDPDISMDQVALAEINTTTNTAVAHPSIPEMNNYWMPVCNFGSLVAHGEVTQNNYMEYVDQLMEVLNQEGLYPAN